MNRLAWRLLAFVLLVMLAPAESVFAQPAAPPPAAPPAQPAAPPPAVDDDVPKRTPLETLIEQHEGRVQALDGLAGRDEIQERELGLLKSAVASLKQATTDVQEQARLVELARAVPDRLKQIEKDQAEIQAQLAAPFDLGLEPVTPDATLDELNRRLDAVKGRLEVARANVTAARTVRDDETAEFRRRDERRASIPAEIANANKRLEELRATLAAPTDASDPPAVATARRATLQAEQRAIEARLARLEEELRSYEARKPLVEPRKALSRDRVLVAERPVKLLEERADALQAGIGRITRAEAERAAKVASDAHPVVRVIVNENADLASELETVSALIKQHNAQRQAAVDATAGWRGTYEKVKAQAEEIGLTEFVGIRLRRQRSQLPEVRELTRRLRSTSEEIQRTQSRAFELDGLAVPDIAAEAARLLAASAEPVPPDRADEVRAATETALTKRGEYLRQLQLGYERYTDPTLSTLYEAQQAQLDLVREYRDYIDERVLWTRSAEPLQISDAGRLLGDVRWLIDPSAWWGVGVALVLDMRANPLMVGLGLLLVLVVLAVRRRLGRELSAIARQVRRPTTDRFGLTLRAGLDTLIIAIAWPAVLWLPAWRLGHVAPDETFALGVGAGLRRAAVLLLAAEIIRQACRTDGLVDAHFRWRSSVLKTVRRHVRWLVILTLPLAFVLALTEGETFDQEHDVLGRLAFIGAMVALAIFAQRLLRPHHGIFQTWLTRHRGGWLDRLKYVWFPAGVLTPLVLAVTAAMGYLYTALQLERRLLDSVWLVLAAVLIHSLLLRWLFVVQRRLAIEQARKKQAARLKAEAEAQAQAEASGGEVPAASESLKEASLDEATIDVASVSAQTRRLVRSVIAVGVLVGIAVVWAEVLPAFGLLREVPLWSQVSTMTSEAGEIIVETSRITLADLGLSLLVLVLTYLVSVNIPGLLEIAILQRLPITPGARYAMSTLVRYLIVIVGVVLAFDAIGIGWSKVQWLVAAMTVGLGFGLQEIFANFVSGLIILFERPIRVGDTVTVGQVNGTVSRIRMRATTIVDWDRKELVIPNKEFITGQIVNWSLSDSVLRVRIPVGVAYGSDTALAKKLLVHVAREDPVVLDDPAPSALFLGFGDSSLSLELRVFIPHIDHFMPIRDTLHSGIDRAFRKAGIEIAFPQRDLHLRSVDPRIALGGMPMARTDTGVAVEAVGKPEALGQETGHGAGGR